MMKKMLMRMLSLALCLMLAAPCALAAGSVMPQEGPNETYLRVTDLAAVGENVYLLAYSGRNMSLWRWRDGMEMAEMVKDDFMRGDDLARDTPMEGTGLAVKYAIAAIASDGERLLGVNPASGLVYEIVVAEDGVTFRDVVTLENCERFYRRSRYGEYFAGVSATAASGEYLYWLGDGWDAAEENNVSRITRFSLADGSAQDLPVDRVTTICAWKEGKICILSRPVGEREDHSRLPYDVSVYDPADGSIVKAGEIDTTRAVSRIAYVPELDSLIWQEGTNIMGMQAWGPEQLYAYVPTSTSGEMAVAGDMLVLSVAATTAVHQLVPGLTVPESLQVMHGSYDQAAQAFAEKYPDVPLEMINESVGEAGFAPWLNPTDGTERVDVLRLYTSNSDDDYTALREAGMLMDLSFNPEIVAWVEGLYPPFREYVTGENGEIWAVPTETVSYTGFFVNRKAMTDMGFTAEEMPTNMVELCEFITMWDAQYADRFPNYCCIEYAENTRRYLADMAIDMWIGHCQAMEQPLHFDDPEFRRVMDAISQVSTVRADIGMQVTNPEISDYKSGLFWVDCQLVGNWAAYMEDYSDRIFIPLTLTENTPFHAEVEGVELWTVNSLSESGEYAAKLVSEQIAQVNDKYAHVLRMDRTEPVESEYYAEQLAGAQRRLGELQMNLLGAENPDAEAYIRQQITQQEAYMATELLRSKYTVTPSAIENYVNVIAPSMYIRRGNVLQDTSEGVRVIEYVRDRWLNGSITTEQFVREVEASLLMIELAQ